MTGEADRAGSVFGVRFPFPLGGADGCRPGSSFDCGQARSDLTVPDDLGYAWLDWLVGRPEQWTDEDLAAARFMLTNQNGHWTRPIRETGRAVSRYGRPSTLSRRRSRNTSVPEH